MRLKYCIILWAILSIEIVWAGQRVTMFELTQEELKGGVGHPIGHIVLENSRYGLKITPKLKDLKVGPHAFHVHEHPNCTGLYKDGEYVSGLSAGGHFDTRSRQRHLGPYNRYGHQGDLPQLCVNEEGICESILIAPRLKLATIKGRSLIIHEHGDNYADSPKKLGGGGKRIACGIIE